MSEFLNKQEREKRKNNNFPLKISDFFSQIHTLIVVFFCFINQTNRLHMHGNKFHMLISLVYHFVINIFWHLYYRVF